VVLPACSGAGMGLYTPAHNAGIMAALPTRDVAAAGGMVNMTRGIGTALGVAAVTLGLHAATISGHPNPGPAVAALAMVVLPAAWSGLRTGPLVCYGRPGQADGRQ
jgi:hypothetical protein